MFHKEQEQDIIFLILHQLYKYHRHLILKAFQMLVVYLMEHP
jgi:hypothetical protein